MVFSSWIVAPRAASSLVSVCFSSSVTGGMGAGSRAEPPPAETAKALGRGEPAGSAHLGMRRLERGVRVPPCGHTVNAHTVTTTKAPEVELCLGVAPVPADTARIIP